MTRNHAIASSMVGLWAALLIFAQPSTVPASAPDGSPTTLRGEKTAVEARVKDGRLLERYLAKDGHDWIEVATAGAGSTMGPVSIIAADGTPLPGKVQKLSAVAGTLVEEFALGAHRIVRTLTITDDGSWVHVVTRFVPSGVTALKQLADHLKFSRRSDWSFSPSVGGFDPHAQYKDPLILVQNDRMAFGIVPDLAALDRKTLKRCDHALDLDVPGGPLLAVGFLPAKRLRHSVFGLDAGRTWTADAPLENSYYLFVTATAAPAQAYRQVVRFHWLRFGRSLQAMAAAQQRGTGPKYGSLALWDDWRKMVWEQESPRQWLSVPLADGSTGGGVRMHMWGPGPSVYLGAWFNSLRTSYGMALWARRTGKEGLLKLAHQTVEIALQAPGPDGAFKCVAVLAKDGKSVIWAAGDGAVGSTKNGLLGYDMCWTGYWLLRWRASHLPGSDAILARCQRLARFMIARQAPDGMLPTRFADSGAVEEERSRTVKAETGPVVLFLLELYGQDRNPQWLAAAKKGLDFLDKDVIPQRQWYDFETFWSCSPRKIEFDQRSGQWPANNLALGQTVAAYLAAYRTTSEARYLATGRLVLDYLLLYQQVWTNPVLDGVTGPAMLLGGFTTQNSDSEWSDARQSQCGNILLDYYRATGNVEYLERGVAALRAQFPVSPSENWGHDGFGNGRGCISSFHWGSGSGMAGIEIDDEYLGDAVVDVASGRGVGVNGLNITQCTIRDGRIDVKFSSPFAWPRQPTIVFHRAEPTRRYQLSINGTAMGQWSGADLEKGVWRKK